MCIDCDKTIYKKNAYRIYRERSYVRSLAQCRPGGLGYGGGDVIHRQERSIYVPPRFRDGSFFVFFSRGAMELPLFENGIYVTLNVDNRVL